MLELALKVVGGTSLRFHEWMTLFTAPQRKDSVDGKLARHVLGLIHYTTIVLAWKTTTRTTKQISVRYQRW
jgi:hypothetical protein